MDRRPHYLRTYLRNNQGNPITPSAHLRCTWLGRALAIAACALLLSCLGACGGGTDDLDDTATPELDADTPAPPPANPCTLNPKACI